MWPGCFRTVFAWLVVFGSCCLETTTKKGVGSPSSFVTAFSVSQIRLVRRPFLSPKDNYHWVCFRKRTVKSQSNGDNEDEIEETSQAPAVPPQSNNADELSSVKIKKNKLNREFVGIAAPALIQLAAEPLAALVDTAYLGRLGPEVLGGAGVAVSAQYAVSKLYNDPLLRTSISLVASQDGKSRQTVSDEQEDQAAKNLSVAVSSALLLAASVGLVQLVVYTLFCKSITIGMGLNPTSPMWHSAVSYLQVRALGTPAATLWLVANGIFRGLGDTRTPLFYSLFFTALNAILDPIFIFV